MNRITSVMSLRWRPSHKTLSEMATEVFERRFSVEQRDFGDDLLSDKQMAQFTRMAPSRSYAFRFNKAESMEAMTVLTRLAITDPPELTPTNFLSEL